MEGNRTYRSSDLARDRASKHDIGAGTHSDGVKETTMGLRIQNDTEREFERKKHSHFVSDDGRHVILYVHYYFKNCKNTNTVP